MRFKKAILRGAGYEPLVRYVCELQDGSYAVKSVRSYEKWLTEGRGEDDWIGWPNKDVYDYDKPLFLKLLNLFGAEETKELAKEWDALSENLATQL